jgi:hypothetical protein
VRGRKNEVQDRTAASRFNGEYRGVHGTDGKTRPYNSRGVDFDASGQPACSVLWAGIDCAKQCSSAAGQ